MSLQVTSPSMVRGRSLKSLSAIYICMKIDDGISFNLETKKLPGAVKIHDGSHDNPFSHSGLETDCFYENTVWRVGY